MRALCLAVLITAAATSANAADLFYEEGIAASSFSRWITPPGAGRYIVEVWTSEAQRLDAQGSYRQHWDTFLAPPPKPHEQNLGGNTGDNFEYVYQVGTFLHFEFIVPETSYRYFLSDVRHTVYGVEVGTPVYEEMKYERLSVGGGVGLLYQPVSYSIRISAAPEPSTWALSILGFGAAGYQLRRRRLLSALADVTP